LLLLAVGSLPAQELAPTYYQGFDTGKLEGPVGKAGNALSVDGYGLLNMDRGTLAFFVQSAEEPKVTEWNHVGPFVGTDRDGGYWSMAMSFATRREDFLFTLFDVGGYGRPIHLPTIFGRWQKGQWHHLCAVWDRQQGIVVYEDGKPIASTWGQQRWGMSPLAQKISTRAPIDEVYFFDVPLTDEQVAQLAAGQKPTGQPRPMANDQATREVELARMGWTGANLDTLPRLAAGQGLELTFARVAGCVDAKRPVAYPWEGLLRTTWPSQKYGPSIRGRRLEIRLDPQQRFDRVRLFAHRPFVGSLHVGVDEQQVTQLEAPDTMFAHVKLAQPVEASQLLLRRRSGQMGQIDFYRAEALERVKPPKQAVAYHFTSVGKFPDTDQARLVMATTPRDQWRPVTGQRAAVEKWSLDAPALGGFQAITEPPAQTQAYDSVVVELVAQSLAGPTPVRVEVSEPVDPERIWLAGDVVLQPAPAAGSKPQRFTLVMRGRPVANTPSYQKRKYLKDGKYSETERIDVPAMGFVVKVQASDAVQWQMGGEGTRVSFVPAADQAAAVARAADDQVEFMREAYAERMEGHGYGDDRLLLPMTWLALHAPQRMEFRQMWERVDANKPSIVGVEIPPLKMPAIVNDSGAPDWAFWQMKAVERIRSRLQWMIDAKQVWTGEYGGVWNDDADHVENWMGYMLCMDGSGKITRSMRRYWDGVWRWHLVDGVGKYTQDAGHFAEEGTMSLGMRLLVEYGDPVAYARAMLASRRGRLWLEPDPAGGYRWKSFWVGPNGAWVERDFYNPRKTGGHQSDVILSMGYLTWYNRHPASSDVLIGLNQPGFDMLGMARRMAQGIEASRPEMEKLLLTPIKTRVGSDVFTALNELGANDDVRKAQAVEYKPVPPIAHYWGSHDTDVAWFRWKMSGDTRYLVDAYQRVLEWYYSHDWLNGEAQPSLDRNPEPRGAIIRSRIGSLAANRGGSGIVWPQHAISFTRGADDVASLVTVNLPNEFAVKLYPMTKQKLDVQLRVWRCNGKFDVALHRDSNDDGVGDEVIWKKAMTLDRGAYLDLALEPGQVSLLTVTPVQPQPIDFNKPDPAISGNSIELVYGGHLVVHVYNNGLKPVDDVLVRVIDARSGQIVVSGEQRTGPIPAPLDLLPQYVTVEFKNIDASVWDDMIIQIDPEQKIDDFTRYNNSVRLSHDGSFDLYDEYRPTVIDGRGRTKPAPIGVERDLPHDEADRLAD
jgi:hypothetical protein